MPVGTLPAKAKDIYEAALEAAGEEGYDDEQAAKIAWGAVKRAGYTKGDDEKWHKMHFAEMHITKAAIGKDGVMRWAATVSKFDTDAQGDEVTPDFYKSAIGQIEAGKRPSPVLCVSHIDHGRPSDTWVPGDALELYIDGGQPKAKGAFRDTALGRAAFKSIRADWGKPDNDKVRISLGFYDEGSEPIETKMDSKTLAGRRFLRGWIKHLALTRVPVIPETSIEAMEVKSMPTTKREDAASIVGDELADELVSLDEKAGLEDETLVKKDETEEKAATKTEDGPAAIVEGMKEPSSEKAYTDERENQVMGLLKALADILGVGLEWPEDINVDNSAALGNRGMNPPRAEELGTTKADTTEETPAVAEFVDGFAANIKAVLLSDGDRTEKFTMLQQHLNHFGEGVAAMVKEQTPPSPRDTAEVIADAVQKAVEPLRNQLAGVKAELEELRVKAVTGEPVSPRPRSLDTQARVVQQPTIGAPPLKKKAYTARELAWETTRERGY